MFGNIVGRKRKPDLTRFTTKGSTSANDRKGSLHCSKRRYNLLLGAEREKER